MSARRQFLLALAGVMLLLTAYVSSGTLDIDEGFSAWLASHASLGSLWHSMSTGDQSDLQMGLYYIYLWAWVHLFGISEYALRAANLPWAFFLAAAVGFTSWRVFQRPVAWAFLFLSPFLCFYVDEARAYTALMGCAAASTGALLLYLFNAPRRLWIWLCLCFLALGILFHLLAVVLGPAFIVIARCYRDAREWRRDWLRPILTALPVFLLLGAFEVWTFTRGTMYGYGGPSWQHIAFVFYTFLGFGGLGPDRDTMQTPASGSWLPYLPWLLLGFVLLAAALLLLGKPNRRAWVLLAAGLAPFCLIQFYAIVAGHRLPTRHFAGLLPLAFFWGLAYMQTATPTRTRIAVAALALLWGLSDIRLRLLPEHLKGDYRGAAQSALQHSGDGDIVWTGDPLTANYYGLGLQNTQGARYYAFDYAQGIQRVGWHAEHQGIAAADWTPAQVSQFLAAERAAGRTVVVALRKCDQVSDDDAWLRYFSASSMPPRQRLRGFDLYVLPGK